MNRATTLVVGAALVAGFFMLSGPVQAAGVQDKINQCESCHGKDGASKHEDIPIIGGMSDYYLEGEFTAYQKELRPCPDVKYPEGPNKGQTTNMCKIAKDLSEDEAKQIAAYFADKPWVPAKQDFDAALAKKGQSYHEEHCSKCHSEGGSLAFDDASILAGQWRNYLEESFKEFRSGKRWMPEKMEPKMKELSDADVKALIEFYVSEQGGAE